jgi:hypothetical protein
MTIFPPHTGLLLCLALLLPAGCSGEGLLSGDGGEDLRSDVRDGAEYLDLLAEPDMDIADPVSDDTDVQACLQAYSGCPCEPGCVDGFSDFVWYPSDAGGPFPEGTSPPPELLAIGIARYQCSICSCDESWSIQEAEGWRDAGALEMCERIVAYDRSCVGCLVIWSGGCC